MNPSKDIRLCNGLLFAVLLTCRKQRTRHNKFGAQDNDGLDEVSVLYGLANVVDPSSSKPKQIGSNIKTAVSRYKSCEGDAEGVLPFSDVLIAENFDANVKNDWSSIISRVQHFCNKFLNVGSGNQHAKQAVSVLVELMKQDSTIEDNQQFYILPNAKTISKAEISMIDKVAFEAFVLGVLHFVVTERRSNTVGESTYNLLFPSKAGGKRSMDVTRLSESLKEIDVDLCEVGKDTHVDSEDEPEIANVEFLDSKSSEAKPGVSFTQNNFNGPIGQYIENTESVVNINYGK